MSVNVLASRQRAGFTLIELVISIVVISIALAAMLGAFSKSMTHSADPLWRNKTIKLAQLYFDEILSKRYDENTPVGGVPAATSVDCEPFSTDAGESSRALFDDVDDYHAPTAAAPQGISGSLHTSYANYLIKVEIECDGSNVSVSNNIDAKKITLTITPPDQSSMVFYAYKGNF